jgi:hypothetical protein
MGIFHQLYDPRVIRSFCCGRCVMRSTITISLCLWLLSQGSSGQRPAEVGQVVSTEKLPSALRIPAILKSTVSSRKSRVGDPVQLEVVVDVHDKNAAVVIPRHSKLYGRVTYVVPYGIVSGWSATLPLPDYGRIARRVTRQESETVSQQGLQCPDENCNHRRPCSCGVPR